MLCGTAVWKGSALRAFRCAGMVLALGAGIAGPVTARAADDPARIAADVLSKSAYQSEFPQAPAPAPPPKQKQPPPASSPPPTRNYDLTPPPAKSPGPDFSFDPTILLFVLGGIGFLTLGFLLLQRIGTAKRTLSASAPTAAPFVAQIVTSNVPAPSPAPAPIDEVERLAAAGRFAEAIHLILLRFLAELRSGQFIIADSLTSREILRKHSLAPTTRDALGIVIGAVELCHFGGRSADERLFRHCLSAYHARSGARPNTMAGEPAGERA